MLCRPIPRIPSILAAALLVFATAGCGDGLGPSLQLDVFSAPIDRSIVPHPPIKVRAEGGGIRVTGSFMISCVGDKVRGKATRRSASSIHIRMWAHREGGGTCRSTADLLYAYRGTIHGVDPGTYTVTVEHQDDFGRPVVTTVVTVP